MAWNTAPGKSEVLLPPHGNQTSTFFLSGKPLRNVESSVYLGVSLTTSGVTEEKHIMRVKAAQHRLMQISPMAIHIRGFNVSLCDAIPCVCQIYLRIWPQSRTTQPTSQACNFQARVMLLSASNGKGGFKIREFQTSEILISLSTGVCGCVPYNIGTSATCYYQGRRIAACKYQKLTILACKTCDLPANNSPCSYPTLASCECRRVLIHSQKGTKPCSGNGNGTVLAQTSDDQYLKHAEDFYPRSCVFRIDTTDF